MALTLAVCDSETGELPEISYDLPRVSIGRAEGSDLRLPDLSVSLRHASIRQRGRDYIVLDEGSTNGTFVGTVRLAPQAPRILQSGDRIRVGRLWIEVRLEAIMPTAHLPLATRDLALQLVSKQLQQQGEEAVPVLHVVVGNNAGTTLALAEPGRRYTLGRSASADLVITDTNASRRHVEVWRQGGQVFLRDLGSKNGSSLDETYLFPDRDQPWHGGARLAIGATRVVLNDPAGEALQELTRGADALLSDNEQSTLLTTEPPARQAPEITTTVLTDASAPVALPRGAPTRKLKPVESSGRVTSADLVVALLALAVLGASLCGLYWMLSGK